MLLVIDIGNTNITLGVYEKRELKDVFRIKTETHKNADFYKSSFTDLVGQYDISGCIICSVVDELTLILKSVVDGIFNINSTLLDYTLELGITLKTDKPETVGADRIANAFYAYKNNMLPAIIVDMGTATTFDVVNRDGEFIGGVIMPGLGLQMESLFLKTSKLPQIDIKESDIAIGNDTESCILSGVVRGHACAIEGLLAQCESELKEPAKILFTGGHSSLTAKYIQRKIDEIVPNLTLEGIRLAYEQTLVSC